MNNKTGPTNWIHYSLLIFGVLCISWSAILVKLANVDGIASAFYRMFFGTLGILPVWFFFRKPISDYKGVLIAIVCGALFASDIAFWNTSIMLSKASVSTLLANLAPIWVGIGALLFHKDKPGKSFWIGTATAILGVWIIVGPENIGEINLTKGNIFAIIASLFYGIYLLTTKYGRKGLDTFSFTSISMISSTVVLGVLCFFSDVKITGYSTNSWIFLLILGLIPQVAGWLAINQSLGHIKPTTASVTLLSQSVFTAVFAIPVLGELLTLNEIGGAALVLAGIYMVNKS